MNITHKVSLCDNAYGCSPVSESQIGQNWTCEGTLTECGSCISSATDLIRFFFTGQKLRWLGENLYTKAQYEDLLLVQYFSQLLRREEAELTPY